jgi:hypothetical protein
MAQATAAAPSPMRGRRAHFFDARRASTVTHQHIEVIRGVAGVVENQITGRAIR